MTMSSLVRPLSAITLAFAFVALTPATAHAADTDVGVDLSATAAQTPSGLSGGYGIGGRFGQRFSLLFLKLTPELGVNYHNFSQSDAIRGVLGGRVGINFIVEPSVFAHVGIGHVGGAYSGTGGTADVGGSLDLGVIPFVNFGAHVAYNTLTGSQAVQWVDISGHVDLIF
jgi:hypothetical protein